LLSNLHVKGSKFEKYLNTAKLKSSHSKKLIKAPSTRAIFMWQFSMLQFLFGRVDDEK